MQRKTEELPERGNGERLKNYAESFQGLSQIFLNMSAGKEKYAADELGRVQNELTGKVCASCDSAHSAGRGTAHRFMEFCLQ